MKEVLFDVGEAAEPLLAASHGVYANRADAEAQPPDCGRKNLKSKRKGQRDEKTIEDGSDRKP